MFLLHLFQEHCGCKGYLQCTRSYKSQIGCLEIPPKPENYLKSLHGVICCCYAKQRKNAMNTWILRIKILFKLLHNMDQYYFMQSFLITIRILPISHCLFTEILRNIFEIIRKCQDCSLCIQTAPLTHIKNHSASSCKATCATQLSGALSSSVVAPCSVLKKGKVKGQAQVLWRRHTEGRHGNSTEKNKGLVI